MLIWFFQKSYKVVEGYQGHTKTTNMLRINNPVFIGIHSWIKMALLHTEYFWTLYQKFNKLSTMFDNHFASDLNIAM